MKRQKYRCNECNKYFNQEKYYEEKHGLDSPPYEKVAICPKCGSGDFFEFDFNIDKTEVAERILPVISLLNGYLTDIRSIFGDKCNNVKLSESVGMLCEFVLEMFSFASVDIEKRILKSGSDNETERIMLYLKGGL